MWNTVVDMARAMLRAADLPKEYWGAAIKHAVFIRNRSPTAALDGQSPFQVLMKAKPDLSVLRKFGCRAFVHTEKAARKKWDDKAREGDRKSTRLNSSHG